MKLLVLLPRLTSTWVLPATGSVTSGRVVNETFGSQVHAAKPRCTRDSDVIKIAQRSIAVGRNIVFSNRVIGLGYYPGETNPARATSPLLSGYLVALAGCFLISC